jgi:hypothetical protein
MDEKHKEIILKFIDQLILVSEFNEIRMKKVEAVERQDYALASELRKKELEISNKIPNIQDLKNIREEIKNI